jgi:hypothetical protein
MMRAALFLVLALVSGCAGQSGTAASQEPARAPAAAAQSSATKITYVVTSWGHTMEEWSIDSAGRASLVLRPRDMRLDAPITPTVYAVSATDFERVRAALAPAERLAGRHFSCANAITDAPSGSVTWVQPDGGEKRVSWYGGCLQPDADRDFLFDHTEAARSIFGQATGAQ